MDLTRRQFMQAAGIGITGTAMRVPTVVGATGPRSARPLRRVRLVARQVEWDIGRGSVSPVWSFNGSVPGPEIRARVGERIRIVLENQLPISTTVHWHGLPVPHAMDGVPVLTQPPVGPGETFAYEFDIDLPGTYWYHSHYGLQLDRGLYGSLIVEDPADGLHYDREHVLVLDDWLTDPTHPVAADLSGMIARERDLGLRDSNAEAPPAMPRGPEGHDGQSAPEPVYDAYLINGHTAGAVPSIDVQTGDRVRLRIINASGADFYPLYLAGHRFTVTHADGHPILPMQADVLVIGAGERYDVIVEANNPGIWALSCLFPHVRNGGLRAVLAYRGVERREPDITPPGRPFVVASYASMRSADPRPDSAPDRIYELELAMRSPTYWTINGTPYSASRPLEVRQGERVELRMRNAGVFVHPMHLHGHIVDVVSAAGTPLAIPIQKDTVFIQGQQEHVVRFTANNPGPRWFFHCHNLYHHMNGMAIELAYA